jgi:hypothetical protein
MAQVVELWEKIVPKVREGVTGIGVWTALKTCVPIALEEGVIVLGIPSGGSELGGHLRMPQTARLIESLASSEVGSAVKLRVIDGATIEDWEVNKRRDIERRRMQEAEMNKMRAQLETRTNWDTIYEKLSREFAATPNRSLPQSRARFFDAAISIISDARRELGLNDEANERSFARCIERVAQYTEIPSAYVAFEVLKRSEEI